MRFWALLPGWLWVLIVIAIVAWILNAVHIITIHFNVGGGIAF